MLATFGPSISYINIVFNSLTRWLLLLVILLVLTFRQRLFSGLTGATGMFVYLFLGLCLLSTLWSDVPALSGPKSATYALVSLCYAAGGAYSVERLGRDNALRLFWPLAVLALLAGFGGAVVTGATLQMNQNVSLYRGLAYNPNFLGILLLCAVPPMLWLVVRPATNRLRWVLCAAILAGMLLLLLRTFSRASLLGLALLAIVTLFGMGARKIAGALALALLASILVAGIYADQVSHYFLLYVFKGAGGANSVFESRLDAWADSLEGASAGGLLGLGFGVSYGFTNFQFGLSSALYGREKGNVSLAMIEEVGIVGFGLFLLMLIAFYARMIRATVVARRRDDTLLLHILMGSVLALLANAQFEAWLLSPGGAATPVFWTLIGMSSRIAVEVRRDSRRARQAHLATHEQFHG